MKIFKKFNDLDAILISSKANKFYFGNRYSSRGYVLLVKGEENPILFIDYRSQQEFHDKPNVIILQKDDKPLTKVNEVLVLKDINKMGFEGNDVTYEMYRTMEQSFTCSLISLDLDIIRYIKSNIEIEKVKRACVITDKTYEKIKSMIKVGMSELELASLINKTMYDFGADELAFDTIVASGINSTNPHAKPSHKKIAYGDVVTMDFGARKDGYCSDMTRTVFVGEVGNLKLREIYEVVLSAHKKVAANTKANMISKDIDKMARDDMKTSGYDKYFVHHLGHSIGIECHEAPRLSATNETVLADNMLFTNEPGVYVDEVGGVRIENTFVIQDGEYKSLHESSIELYVVEVNDEK